MSVVRYQYATRPSHTQTLFLLPFDYFCNFLSHDVRGRIRTLYFRILSWVSCQYATRTGQTQTLFLLPLHNFWHFLYPSARSRIQTLYLRIMSVVSYQYATRTSQTQTIFLLQLDYFAIFYLMMLEAGFEPAICRFWVGRATNMPQGLVRHKHFFY